MKRIELLIQLAVVAVCAAILWLIWSNAVECEATGGAYVRGVWGMVCVAQK